MAKMKTALYPDLTWHGGEFVADLAVLMSEGGILALKPAEELEAEVRQARESGEYITSRRLPDRALLPGFINTHSHAFQRAIRGRTEFPGGEAEDFWSWRGLMYQAAQELEPADLEAVSQAVFVEMVKCGITRVGEFHYLHHRPDGTPYPNPDELLERVLSGATSAGIEVTLLRAFYQRAGFGRPRPEGAQKIFSDPDLDYYLSSLERLRDKGIPIAVTAHSVRAVPRPELGQLLRYASERDLPFHIHASEQRKEIEETVEEHGLRPVELLRELGGLSPRTTLVHAIHLTQEEIEAIGAAGSFIASCPTTERNLGDGIVPARELLAAGAKFTFGTDSQCQIWLPEDARQLEYHLRLREERRSLLFSNADRAGGGFLDMLTVNGAASLGAEGEGVIEVGAAANLVAVDLDHLSLAGTDRHSLPLDLVFSAAPSVVTDVWIRAAEVVSEGYHRAERQARTNLHRVMRKLRARTPEAARVPR